MAVKSELKLSFHDGHNHQIELRKQRKIQILLRLVKAMVLKTPDAIFLTDKVIFN